MGSCSTSILIDSSIFLILLYSFYFVLFLILCQQLAHNHLYTMATQIQFLYHGINPC